MGRTLTICFALALGACGEPQTESKAEAEPAADSRGGIRPYDPSREKTLDFSGVDIADQPLQGGSRSERELGEALVGGLAAKDRAALEGLLLTKDEYARLFPVLIRHPNGLKMGHELAWKNLQGESRGDLDTALARHGGQPYTFVRLVPQDVLERPKVRVHVRPAVLVRDDSGREQELVLLGSVVEHQPSNTWKIVAFRDTR